MNHSYFAIIASIIVVVLIILIWLSYRRNYPKKFGRRQKSRSERRLEDADRSLNDAARVVRHGGDDAVTRLIQVRGDIVTNDGLITDRDLYRVAYGNILELIEQEDLWMQFVLYDRVANDIDHFGLGVVTHSGHEQAATQRAESIISTSKDANEARTKFFDVEVMNDGQNSHDTAVNKDMKNIVDSIFAHSGRINAARELTEIGEYIKTFDPIKSERAARTLKTFADFNNCSTFGRTDGDILAAVWTRYRDPDNDPDDIRDAIIDALADSYDDHGSPVCMNGRIARVVGALSVIDAKFGKPPATVSMLKQQCFNESSEIIRKYCEELGEDHEDVKKYGEIDGQPSNEFLVELNKRVLENAKKYQEKMGASSFNMMLEEIKVGLSI